MNWKQVLLLVSLVVFHSPLQADDWAQWRGPGRNGAVQGGPELAREWGQNGPKLVWESPIPHGQRGSDGYGSPVVADGRVHQLVTWTVYKPTRSRVLTTSSWKRMGAYDPCVPVGLRKKIEAARLSSRRAAIRKKSALKQWLEGWLETNLSEAERKKYGDYARNRLRSGEKAASPGLLAKLKPVLDKPFADSASLEVWLKSQNITGADADRVRRAAPARKAVATDTIVTFDAKTGRRLWQADFPGGLTYFGTSGTPCVKDGRVYVTGAAAAYCLDAATGKTVWRTEGSAYRSNSSPVVADGVMVFVAGGVCGLDAKTGKPLWKIPPDAKPDSGSCLYRASVSATVRRVGGKARALLVHRGKLVSIEMKTGRIAWKARGYRSMTTPALRGNLMVCQGNIYGCGHGLIAYRLTPKGPEVLGKTDKTAQGRGASAVLLEGRALAAGREGTVCMAVPSGKIIFESRELRRNLYSSPIVADGKLLIVAGSRLRMFDVSKDELYELASAELGLLGLTSPALVDGLLYVRAKKSIKCFDLRVHDAKELEAIHAWKRRLAKDLCGKLDDNKGRAALRAARRLARLGPAGKPALARRIKAATADGDAGRLAILIKGAVGTSRTVRSMFIPPLREAMKGKDRDMLRCAIQHWKSVDFPASEARKLMLGLLRRPVKDVWKGAAEQLLAMDAKNVGDVVDALRTMIPSEKETLRQEAALLIAHCVGQGADEAVRKRSADAAASILEAMVLSGPRADEARAALIELKPTPKKPQLDDGLPELDS